MTVIDTDQLRPTPDRVRETLFNWLQPYITGAYCLDLFAGTGALGFEAVSRGAKQVIMIERDGQLIQQLREQIRQLDTNDIITEQFDALTWLRATTKLFDIVFLDPPFGQGMIEKSCDLLKIKVNMRVGGMIYIESGQPVTLPTGWCVKKQTTAGQVQCMLLTSELADEIS